MTDEQIEQLRQRLPLLHSLEERGFVQFCSNGVYVIEDVPLDDFLDARFRDEFAIADEWSGSDE